MGYWHKIENYIRFCEIFRLKNNEFVILLLRTKWKDIVVSVRENMRKYAILKKYCKFFKISIFLKKRNAICFIRTSGQNTTRCVRFWGFSRKFIFRKKSAYQLSAQNGKWVPILWDFLVKKKFICKREKILPIIWRKNYTILRDF